MMKNVFCKRLHIEWQEKYKAISSTVDWTVAVYIILPIIIFGGLYYKSWWEEFPEWIHSFPSFVLFFFLYVFVTKGEVRSFLEEGDQLFLIQYSVHMKQLMKRGIVYTFFRILLANLLIVVVLLPFLFNWLQLDLLQIIWLYSFFSLFRFAFSFFNRFMLCYQPPWWKKQLILILVRSVSAAIFISGCVWGMQYDLIGVGYIVFLIVMNFLLIKRKLHSRYHFYAEVQREIDCRMRWTKMILVGGMHVTKSVSRLQSRIFPMSKKLFRHDTSENRIIESYIKTYFRRSDNRVVYIQLVLASCIGIIFTPIWIKIVIVAFMLFSLSQLAKGEWNILKEGMFIKLYCEEGETLLAASKGRGYIAYPAFMIIACVFLGMFSVWLGVISFILVIIILLDYAL
jgi:ABC-2 type transport system permease protein